MTVPAIGALSATLPTVGSAAPAGISGAPGAAATASAGSDFGSMLSKGLDSVQQAQGTADTLAQQAATGDLTDISSYTIAATQASLVTQLATTLQTKGIAAFNEIMGMQA